MKFAAEERLDGPLRTMQRHQGRSGVQGPLVIEDLAVNGFEVLLVQNLMIEWSPWTWFSCVPVILSVFVGPLFLTHLYFCITWQKFNKHFV